MNTNANKTTGSTRKLMVAMVTVAMTSLTAVAANAAKPDVNRVCVDAPVATAKSTSTTTTSKNVRPAKNGETTAAPADTRMNHQNRLDSSVIAPYHRWMQGAVSETAFA